MLTPSVSPPSASSPRAASTSASSSNATASRATEEDGAPLLQSTSVAPSTGANAAAAAAGPSSTSNTWARRPASVFGFLWSGRGAGGGGGGGAGSQQQQLGVPSPVPSSSASSSSSSPPPDVESGGSGAPTSSLLKRSSSLLPRVPSLGGLLSLGGNAGSTSTSDSGSASPSPSQPPPCCLICLDPLTEEDFASGAAMRLECSCRGDLALRHRACAERWSEVKGDRRCDVCRSVVENLPEPPPRPPPPQQQAEEGLHPHGLEGVPPHLLPFVFGPNAGSGSGGGGSRVVSPFWAAIVAERGSDAGVAAHLMHPVPPISSADAAFDFLRVAWIGTIISLLWLDMPLPESFISGAIAAVIYTAVVRATASAQVAALRRELAAAAEAAAAARGGAVTSGSGGSGGGR